MEPRRLVVLFDGTWNKREHTTNVWRTRMMLRHDVDQLIYYDEGVGTPKGEVLTGGALGSGVSEKVLKAYLWLMENYEDQAESRRGVADELSVFGFSRGAFSARSLVGLISISGLIHRDAATRIVDAFNISRVSGIHESHDIARSFRKSHSRTVAVNFLGVWDTVGALGVPHVKGLPRLRVPLQEQNAWHKVKELPSNVRHARHALAIDERREAFSPTLWPAASPQTASMEQRWFSGAHANVGGGYENDALFRRPLQWITDEAASCGLTFRKRVAELGDFFYGSPVRNSLDEALFGSYYLAQGFRPFHRVIDISSIQMRQTIDYTVLVRWLLKPDYAPPRLADYVGRKSALRRRIANWSMTDTQVLAEIPMIKPVGNRGFNF